MAVDDVIAQRISELRTAQRLSLSQLAERSGVSKAMISKIERRDSSPTAAVLGRLASGLGVALTELLAPAPSPNPFLLRHKADQTTWRDPATGYVRRQVAELDEKTGTELIEIELPAGARIDYPQWHSKPYRQRLWLLKGVLELGYGDETRRLVAGDQLDFAVDKAVSYFACEQCRYLLNVLHA
ncbi:transcriptional regulator [Streptomyces cavourensis]|jgi:transcriptional regulator with XRE-family HTH domain|uniref:helix-turn-helix domain-containing protein n=1 Tax=unclassified Achromobacter TaxID=2626865 RepID=UPI000E0805BD|nr:transcriptional regulator [Streptomyces cavourensis]